MAKQEEAPTAKLGTAPHLHMMGTSGCQPPWEAPEGEPENSCCLKTSQANTFRWTLLEHRLGLQPTWTTYRTHNNLTSNFITPAACAHPLGLTGDVLLCKGKVWKHLEPSRTQGSAGLLASSFSSVPTVAPCQTHTGLWAQSLTRPEMLRGAAAAAAAAFRGRQQPPEGTRLTIPPPF